MTSLFALVALILGSFMFGYLTGKLESPECEPATLVAPEPVELTPLRHELVHEVPENSSVWDVYEDELKRARGAQ